MVEAHKGDIGVISEENEGATFWLSIPSTQKDNVASTIEEYIDYLKPHLLELKKLDVFQISEIKKVLKQIEVNVPAIKQWKQELEAMVYNGDESGYRKMIDISNNYKLTSQPNL